ncbi:MAG: DUF4199 domain-containing protein [Bacteroidia bacterium]
MKPSVKYGVLSGLILGVILFISMMMAPSEVDYENPFASGIGGGIMWWLVKTALLFGLFFMAVKETRDKLYDGYITFGGGFKTAYGTAWITMLVYLVVAAVYYYIFNPDWYPVSWDQLAEQIEDSSAPQELDAALKMGKLWYDYMTEIVLVGWVLLNAIALAILSLIVAAIGQKDDPNGINL